MHRSTALIKGDEQVRKQEGCVRDEEADLCNCFVCCCFFNGQNLILLEANMAELNITCLTSVFAFEIWRRHHPPSVLLIIRG